MNDNDPKGPRLLPMPADPAEWHALRAQHVGASEAAILFGCEPAYAMGLRALWEVKAGRHPPPHVDNPRTRWGLALEDAIAAAAAGQEGWDVQPGRYASLGGLGATLDRIIAAPNAEDAEMGATGPGVLELKSVDWLQHRAKWAEDPPEHILLQHQAQMAATGFNWGAVAALVGGNDLKVYRYLARPRIGAAIISRVETFWVSVREGNPPAADGSDATYRMLMDAAPEVADAGVDLMQDNEAPELCARYLALGAKGKAIDAERAEVRNRLIEKLGPHRVGWVQGFRLSQAVTAEKPDRQARPGEIIRGRAESRRLIISEGEAA